MGRDAALTSAFVVHVLVGVGAVVALLSSDALRDSASFFLWIVGVPWVAGLVAFFGWPRASSGLAWVLPGVPLLTGVAVWLMTEVAAGMG
jgi:hypothetical protein